MIYKKKRKGVINFILFQYVKHRFLITLQRYNLYFNLQNFQKIFSIKIVNQNVKYLFAFSTLQR